MGAHSLPRPSRTDAGRIAGVGVLAALTLAGGAGVASAHGTGPGDDDGDGHGGRTVSRTDDTDGTSTADPGGICAVLGDVDLPGLDCTSDGTGTASDGRNVTPTSVIAPGTSNADDADRDSTTSTADTRPQGAPASSETDGAQSTGSTPAEPATQNAASTQNGAQNTGASPSQAQPKTTGNPVDAPAAPGTTRTLPIGG